MSRYHVVIAGIIGFLVSCGNKPGPPALSEGPVKVVVEPVRTTDAVYNDEYPATVVPLHLVELKPQVSGFITAIHFKDGDRVKKGQLLYSIDAQLYNANYEQAVANLKVQEANLLRAQKDADRYHELARQDAVARQLVDNADAALEVAKKQAEAAKANISGMETSVRYTKIYAPFEGVIGISEVKPGAAVTAGQTRLNTISTDDELAVDFHVGQQEIYRFNKLISTPARDSVFRLAFGGEEYPFPGKLVLLDRAVDPQTGTLRARLVFPNKERLLMAGMTATVRVRNSTPGALLIPYKSVTELLGAYFVYTVGDSNRVSQKKVTLGKPMGRDVIIVDGLQPGDTVVTEGVQDLREGAVIEALPGPDSTGKTN